MAKNLSRTLTRTLWIVLAIGLVVGATVSLTQPYDQQKIVAETVARLQKHPATPGGADILRQVIAENQRGQPDYTMMSKDLSDRVRQQLPFSTAELTRLGPLQSLTYLGVRGNADVYRASFKNGWRFWGIGFGKDRLIDTMFFFTPGIPAPQDYRDSYASFTWPERSMRLATQFALLLGIVLFGRFALRLRL